uniref:Uncharacterized protein n=1 Tax=Meloidogyne hapla TaxID=6305 RepID=A0A1I8B0T4_MELHA
MFPLNLIKRNISAIIILIGGSSAPGCHLNNGELLKFDFTDGIESFKTNHELLNYKNIKGFSCSAFCQIEGIGGFIFGGYDGNECLNQILKIDEIEPHNVNLLSPLPFGLKNAAALPSPDKQRIWIIGGWDGYNTQKMV